MWIAERPERFAGQRVGSGQCVAFVQAAAGAPHTSQWRAGAAARGNPELLRGTAIATFDPPTGSEAGRYGNHTDGRSHAAIFWAEDGDGLLVWDQWLGQPVHRRLIRFRGGRGRAVNDGDRYRVIVAAEA